MWNIKAWNFLLIIQRRNRDFESDPRCSFLATEVPKSRELNPRKEKESWRRSEAQNELIDHESENDLFSAFLWKSLLISFKFRIAVLSGADEDQA